MSTSDGMGDRKPGGRGFRAGRTGFSAVRTTDAEGNPDEFVLPDFHWVLRPVNPAHVPDDSKAGSGGFTCKTATGSVVKAVMGGSGLPPVVLSPVQSVTSPLLRRAVRSRRCTWNAPRKLLYLACPVSVGSLKHAITVQTAVGLLLTLSKGAFFDVGALQEKVVVDLGIDFPDDLMLEPAEGGSLDEALKARAPSLLCSAPGESLGTAKELLIKFHGKEVAEIVQAYAAARECRRKGEVARSLPVMDFLVVPLFDIVFVDVTPAIVVSNAGDDCDRDEFETDEMGCSVLEVFI